MDADRREHWDRVYGARAPTEVTWYAPHLGDSLRLIRAVAPPDAAILDVGGGASTLVDDLLDAGFGRVTVLDVSEVALGHARARLGPRAQRVAWLCADVTTLELPEASCDVWHDRAVFHFLTAEADRRAYARTLARTLAPGGHAVIGTFSLHGPEKCSGLSVVRYDAASLQRELGPSLVLDVAEEVAHVTPGGKSQSFVLCRFTRTRP